MHTQSTRHRYLWLVDWVDWATAKLGWVCTGGGWHWPPRGWFPCDNWGGRPNNWGGWTSPPPTPPATITLTETQFKLTRTTVPDEWRTRDRIVYTAKCASLTAEQLGCAYPPGGTPPSDQIFPRCLRAAVSAGYMCLVVLLSFYIVMHCNEMSREQIKIDR